MNTSTSSSSSVSTPEKYSVIGDSNVRHHMSEHNCRDRPLMSEAQVLICTRMSTLTTNLSSVRPDSTVVLLSCLSNFLTGCTGPSSSISLKVEPVFREFLKKLSNFADLRPDARIFVSPPMYRSNPIWYRDGLPEILQTFSSMMQKKPDTVYLLPSFPSPKYEQDGVHLTAYSGSEFVLHLFDSVKTVLTQLELKPPENLNATNENVRVLQDRMLVIEQDHRRLSSDFDLKVAIDAELDDFAENVRNESFFMIQGLRRLPALDTKEWQARARADVGKLIHELMRVEIPISFVQNSTGRGKDSKVLYRVKVESAEVSKSIRDKFGYFFAGGKDARPPSFAGVSIRNCVTPGTLARIAILQVLGRRYRDSNPGSRFTVSSFESRPHLKLFPPEGASDRRVQTFNFIQAVSKLPTCFTQEENDQLIKRISTKLYGKLKQVLVVVNDDMVQKRGDKSVGSQSQDLPPPATVEADVRSGSGPSKLRPKKRGAATDGSGPSSKK